MLVTSKRIVSKEEYRSFRNDVVKENLQRFVLEAAPFIDIDVEGKEDNRYMITHRAIVLKMPQLLKLKHEIADMLNYGANPEIVSRHILHFLIHE